MKISLPPPSLSHTHTARTHTHRTYVRARTYTNTYTISTAGAHIYSMTAHASAAEVTIFPKGTIQMFHFSFRCLFFVLWFVLVLRVLFSFACSAMKRLEVWKTEG